jgi:hypothetical protein
MVQCLEIARYAGFNFWKHETQDGASLKDLIEQYFAWDIKNESFPWNTRPKKSDKRRNCYELAYVHLDISSEIKDWVKSQWPSMVGREGDEYCTLNKGDILGTGILPPEAPTNLNGIPISDKKIKLIWQDNSLNETGFRIERKTQGSSFFSVAVVNDNIEMFEDAFLLSDSTTYIYRVKAFNSLSSSEYSNECTVTTLPVSVEFTESQSEDYTLALFQNYPNPFNPLTTIEFRVPEKDFYTLKIYNHLGEEVETLLTGTISDGRHDVIWNASKLPSGVYYYRLNNKNNSLCKKMILLR